MILTFLLSLSCFLFSQQRTKSILDSIYFFHDVNGIITLEAKNVYFYDVKGNRIKFVYSFFHENPNRWENFEYWTAAYNINNQQIEFCGFDWNSESGTWNNGSHIIREYDFYGNLTSYLLYYWDFQIKAWYGYEHSIAAWDKKGNQIEFVNYRWNSDIRDWTGDYREKYTYDANGNNIERQYFRWDSGLNDWLFTSRSTYIFNSFGKNVESNTFYWDKANNRWLKEYHWTYIYNELGVKTEVIRLFWDLNTSHWKNSTRTLFTWDSEGNMSEDIFWWNSESNSWQINNQIIREYDSMGNTTRTIYNSWDLSISNWKTTLIFEKEFDIYGHLIGSSASIWKSEYNKLVPIYNNTYAYDNNGNKTEEINYEYWEPETDYWTTINRKTINYDKVGNINEEIYAFWDFEANDWKFSSKEVYYWSDFSIPEEEHVIIYPNPFTFEVCIELPENFQIQKIEIIDQLGRIVRSIDNINVSERLVIGTNNLTRGIYFFRIYCSNKTILEKIVVK